MHYHCISVLFVIVLFLLGSLAKPLSPPWDDMHIKHSWNVVPKNWESLGHPPSGTTIDLHIALRPQRENAMVDALHEVSEPGHPRYRAYLTKGQVADLVAPHPETLELVNSWLEHHSISPSSISMTHGGNTLTLKRVSVTQANTLLGASYQLYRHVERGETIVRTVGYSLPRALHWHVLTVAPTTSFVSPRTQWQTPRNCSDGAVMSTSEEPAMMLSSRAKVNRIMPSFLRWLYETEAYTPNTRGENVLGVLGFLGYYPSQTDLTAFMQKFRSEAGDATYTVVLVNGGEYDPTHPQQEANVDLQYAEVMAYPTPHIFYSIGQGAPGMEDLFSWLEYILDQENIPQTISISYGIEERLMSREYAINVCDQFVMLGVRGVSVLVSSGNDGIGKGTCLRDDGTVRFNPRFPGTCPYVTVVGGTTGHEPEVAVKFSGGGFSDYFKRPSYQEEAVSTYLQDLGNRYQGLYNASGRGFPDIAAQALGLPIFLEGKVYGVGGTSVATPIVAGIISLLNDWLILTGQAPLGFLNPWLYGRGSRGLTDITEGSNSGCNMDGFPAIVGWDPVTGLGTPNFRRMLEQLF
ncbi:peptidase S8/S53 domain-containing protein [Lactarius akahatsu]|uniref:tripeptidyl-peptidase II n=1 Tax=Lactarius akahatsu TaxID=416441 RepID=A0AAD4LBP5_9AGAM|nr:peptidase S8/S53 domain-containing protein [Lactarius akahatsu]